VLVLIVLFTWMLLGYFFYNGIILTLASGVPFLQGLTSAFFAMGYDLIQVAIGIATSLALLGAGQRLLKKRIR
jgi:hypothetical protein